MTATELDARLALATRILRPLLHDLASRRAQRWIARTLVKSRRRCNSAKSLKSQWEAEEDYYHLPQVRFDDLLAAAGLLWRDGTVHAEYVER
jgi:hypothetical protein